MNTLLRYTLLSALILPAIACKGPTGISGGKQLNELSDDEQIQACENVEDYYIEEIGEDRLIHGSCVALASFFTSNEDECEVFVDMCKRDAMESEEGEEEVDECTAEEVSCTATVAEYEACIEEEVEATKDGIDALTCAAIFSDNPPDMDPPPGPECEAFAKKCPGYLDAPVEGE